MVRTWGLGLGREMRNGLASQGRADRT
jgi:hypothetical protein